MAALVDPALQNALTASAPEGRLPVVFTLHAPAQRSGPDAISSAVDAALARAAAASGLPAPARKLFPNLMSFSVEARPAFIQALLSDPAIAAAIGEHSAGEVAIKPVEGRGD
ncbi:MAG: hypothetical protein E6G97_14405 [Alphaproteobacteria bacterium]|nr:MAG: hypothetical protein E6G97_14405 [Alphaproteobacteria bacterium]